MIVINIEIAYGSQSHVRPNQVKLDHNSVEILFLIVPSNAFGATAYSFLGQNSQDILIFTNFHVEQYVLQPYVCYIIYLHTPGPCLESYHPGQQSPVSFPSKYDFLFLINLIVRFLKTLLVQHICKFQ